MNKCDQDIINCIIVNRVFECVVALASDAYIEIASSFTHGSRIMFKAL